MSKFNVGDKARVVSTNHTRLNHGYGDHMPNIGDIIQVKSIYSEKSIRDTKNYTWRIADLEPVGKEVKMEKYKVGDVVRIVNLDGVGAGNIGDTYIIGEVKEVCGDTMYSGCEKTKVEGGCFLAKNLFKLNYIKSEEFLEKKIKQIFGEDWKNVKLKTDAHGDKKNPITQNGFSPIVTSESAWNKYGRIYFRGKWAVPLNQKEHNKTTVELDLTGSTDTNNNTTNNKSKPKGNYVKIQNLRRKAKTVRGRTGTGGSRVASKRRTATASVRHSRNRKSPVWS